MSELIGYAQFLDRRERRRTADRGRAFPGAAGSAGAGASGAAVIECEPIEPSPCETRTARAMKLAEVATPARGPVSRWRARTPVPFH